jgi:hypothetical protein
MWRLPVVTVLTSAMVAATAHAQAHDKDAVPVSVVQRFVDGFNARDLDAMVGTVAEEVVFVALPSGDTIAQGREGVRAHYRRSFERVTSGFTVHIATRISDGAFVTDFEQFQDGTGNPQGHATWVYFVRDGYIQHAWVLRQVQSPRP